MPEVVTFRARIGKRGCKAIKENKHVSWFPLTIRAELVNLVRNMLVLAVLFKLFS